MISINAQQLEHAQSVLNHIPNALPKALSRAINRAAAKAKTVVVNKTAENYYVDKRDIRSTITMRSATAKRPTAFVKSKGTRRELKHSLVLPNLSPSHITRSGPFIAVKKGSTPSYIANTFINIGRRSGKVHVFSRIDGQRMPWVKYGVSVPQMIDNENVKQSIEDTATAFLNERLEHEIDVVLRGVVR